MIEEWSNQLLYGGSDLIDDLDKLIQKQKENYVMSFLQKMSNGDIMSVSYRTMRALAEYLAFKMGQPIHHVTIKTTPFENNAEIIINSTNAGIAKILEKLADDQYAASRNEKTSEPACITVDKVIFNKRTTVILWKDGTKTKIRCSEKDQFDEETAVAICMIRKILGPGYKRAIRDILKTKAKRYE